MRHVHHAQRRCQPPGRADEVIPHIGHRHDGIIGGELVYSDGQNVGADQTIECCPQPVADFPQGPPFIRHGGVGRGVCNAAPCGIGRLDVIGYSLLHGLVIVQAIGHGQHFRARILSGRVGNAGIHGFAHFLIDPRNRPVGRTGNKPTVLLGNLLKVLQLGFELPLFGVALQRRKNSGVDVARRIVQCLRINGIRWRIGISKLTCHRGQG